MAVSIKEMVKYTIVQNKKNVFIPRFQKVLKLIEKRLFWRRALSFSFHKSLK